MNTTQFNTVVEDYADNLYRFVLGIVRIRAVAEDVVQESFSRVWENRRKVEPAKSKSYLFTIAYNLAISELRARNRRQSEDFSLTQLATQGSYNNLTEMIWQTLDTMSETQRSVIILCDWEGYSYHEITQIMGLSLAQVKIYIHRTRNLLKERLQDEYRD